jgi:hypothetical protein
MNNKATENGELWRLYISLANYAPDITDEFEVHFHDYVRRISEEEYLTSIYVDRAEERFETNLAHEMQRASKILCVAGERGAGKTSALQWVRRHLAEEAPELRFELIDIRKAYDTLDLFRVGDGSFPRDLFSTLVVRSFKRLVRDQLLSRLFPDLEDMREIVAWSLSGPPDSSSQFPREVVSDLQSLYAKAASHAPWQSGHTREQRRKLLLEIIHKDTVVYDKLRESLMERLRPTHVVHAFVSIHDPYKKVLVVLDNIDRIPSDLQSYFLAACRDIQLSFGPTGAIVVAIRTENVRGVGAVTGDELFVDIIVPDGLKYSGILLPSLEAAHAEQVLERRAEFVAKILEEYDQRHKTQWHHVQQAHLHLYHMSVVREFIQQRVHALTNDSCRVLLNVYVEFMRFIWTAAERKDLTTGKPLLDLTRLDEEEGKYLQTLFFLWLHQRGTEIGIPLQHIIEEDLNLGAERFADAVSPRYLILSCIHNLKRERSPLGLETQYPRWSDVVSRMKTLGYQYKHISDTFRSYLSPVGEPAGILRFARRELRVAEVAEDSDDGVILTRLGEEILTNVINRVGYIWGVARRQLGAEGETKSYFEFTTRQRAQHVYDFCKQVAHDHLWALSLIGNDWRPEHGKGWTERYRRHFGVNGQLQCEGILESASRFYNHLFGGSVEVQDNAFSRLKQSYTSLFHKLAVQEELTKDDFLYLDDGDDLMQQMGKAIAS